MHVIDYYNHPRSRISTKPNKTQSNQTLLRQRKYVRKCGYDLWNRIPYDNEISNLNAIFLDKLTDSSEKSQPLIVV